VGEVPQKTHPNPPFINSLLYFPPFIKPPLPTSTFVKGGLRGIKKEGVEGWQRGTDVDLITYLTLLHLVLFLLS
jgi:hypothetical protein